MFSIFFHPEGNFDIDAGDGGGGGNPPTSQKSRKKIVRQLFTLLEHFSKNAKSSFQNISIYTEKTPKTINAFKIKKYYTKHTQNTILTTNNNIMFENIENI